MKRNDILDQIFEKGHAIKELTLLDGRLKLKMKNLETQDQIRIEKEMENVKGNSIYTIHSYTLKLLASVLVEWKGTEIDPKEADRIINNLPSKVVDRLVSEHKKFEKEISKALDVDEIKENFSPAVEQSQDSEQPQEA